MGFKELQFITLNKNEKPNGKIHASLTTFQIHVLCSMTDFVFNFKLNTEKQIIPRSSQTCNPSHNLSQCYHEVTFTIQFG
jgi:hypothetical protein